MASSLRFKLHFIVLVVVYVISEFICSKESRALPIIVFIIAA